MNPKKNNQKKEKSPLPYIIRVVWPLESGTNVAKVIDGVFLLLHKQYAGKYLVLSQIYTKNEELIGLRCQIRASEQVEILRSTVVDNNCLQFVFFVYPAPPTD